MVAAPFILLKSYTKKRPKQISENHSTSALLFLYYANLYTHLHYAFFLPYL